MKRISHYFTTTLLSAMAILSTGCSNKTTHMIFNDLNSDKISISGRVVEQDGKAKWSYPGVKISTKFKGSKITMLAKPNCGYFWVEGYGIERKKIEIPESGEVILADNLNDKVERNLKIVYCNEGQELQPEFYGFATEGDLIKNEEAENKTKFYFIGNSITCGYGVDGDRSQTFNYATEDFTKTFAYQISEKFDADYIVFAKSGYGIYRNYGDAKEGSTVNMSTLYDYTLFTDSTYKWDHSSVKADVVFLNLGTNDTSEDNYDIQKFKSATEKFVAKLRATNPESKIILMTGPMMHSKALADVMMTLDEIAFEMAKNGDDKIFRFNFTPDDGKFGYGTDWHPNAEKQNDMTNELLEFMTKHEIMK